MSSRLASSYHSQSPTIAALYADPTSLLLVKNVICWRGFEGPQICFEWTSPQLLHTSVMLRRKIASFPLHPDDGKLVLLDDSGDLNTTKRFSDRNIYPNETFYYTFFTVTQTSRYFADITTQCKMLAIKTGWFEVETWNDVRTIDRVMDMIW